MLNTGECANRTNLLSALVVHFVSLYTRRLSPLLELAFLSLPLLQFMFGVRITRILDQWIHDHLLASSHWIVLSFNDLRDSLPDIYIAEVYGP